MDGMAPLCVTAGDRVAQQCSGSVLSHSAFPGAEPIALSVPALPWAGSWGRSLHALLFPGCTSVAL